MNWFWYVIHFNSLVFHWKGTFFLARTKLCSNSWRDQPFCCQLVHSLPDYPKSSCHTPLHWFNVLLSDKVQLFDGKNCKNSVLSFGQKDFSISPGFYISHPFCQHQCLSFQKKSYQSWGWIEEDLWRLWLFISRWHPKVQPKLQETQFH